LPNDTKDWGLVKALVLVTISFPSVVFAQGIQEIEPDQIATLVANTSDGKPLVIHYTSDDGSCSYCVENNAYFASAAERLSDNFDFAAVTLNPWRQFFETPEGRIVTDFQADQAFPLAGVPAVMIFANGEPIRLLPIANPSLEEALETVFSAISDDQLLVRGDVSVANIPSSQLATYVTAFSADKPLLVTLSSTDEGCPHCTSGNAKVDEVSRYMSRDYVFARIDYNPWRSVGSDTQTANYLDQLGVVVDGLPTSLLFYRGKLLGTVRTNGRDLRTVLSQALPAIKEIDE
jgi:hypothetical protein